MLIFEADDPLVLDGTYDREGFTPKERRAQQRKLKGERMAKKKAPKKTTPKKATQKKKTVKAVTAKAAKLGGAVSKAVKAFSTNLGAMNVSMDDAPAQMMELGELLEDVAKAKDTADSKAADAKTAKATYESKVNLLLEKLRGFTHPKALPLFDATEREQDLKGMQAADETPF